MSNFNGYPTRSFSESQKFFVLDPQTGTPSFVLGSDLVNFLTPGTSFVFSESTRVSAQASNYKVGNLVQTAGAVTEGDGLASGFLVVPGGEGDFAMQNGNDLLVIRGDDLLREQLKEGVVRMPDLAAMESTEGRFDGDAARLVSGTGRDGDFRWDSSDLSATLVLASATSDSVDDTTDTINDADHPFSDGMGVVTQTTVNGLTAQTVYWVVNSTAGTYQLSATRNGGAVDLTGTTNVTIDHLLDPRQILYVTPSTDKTGASGAWKRGFSGAISILWAEAIADYDPVSNTGTDNTDAIQTAINLAARLSISEVYAPAGFYKFTNLYLHYDQSDNGDYPQDDDLQGRIRIVGDGRMTKSSYNTNQWIGTALYSESSLGSAAIHGSGLGSTGDKHKGDYTRLENLSVVVNNSTLAVFLNKCPQYSGISRVFIGQKGSGGGFLHDSVWFCVWEDSFLVGAGKAVSLGKGFQIRNTTLAGGMGHISNVTADDFQFPIWIGGDDRASAERMHSITGDGIQGGSGSVGVHVGAGVVASELRIHAEENDLGFRVLDNARHVDLVVTTASNTKDGEFGSTVADKNYYRSITMHSSDLICDGTEIIQVMSSANTRNLKLLNNSYDGDGTNTAIAIDNVRHNNLKIEDEIFVNVSTKATNRSRAAKFTEQNVFDWTAGQTSEALTEIPFKFRQGSLVGGYPTLGVEQQDGDKAFIEFETPVTPVNSNYNNVNELNGDGSVVGPQAKSAQDGWLFRAMVQVQLNTGDGVETVYLPVYSADPI